MNTINRVSYNLPSFQSGTVSRTAGVITIPISQRKPVQSGSQGFLNTFLKFSGLTKQSVLKIDISGINYTHKKRPVLCSTNYIIASANRALQRVIKSDL